MRPSTPALLTGRVAARRLSQFATVFVVIAIAAFVFRVASWSKGWGLTDTQWVVIAGAGVAVAAGLLLAARYEVAKERRLLNPAAMLG
jgi:hypothetical protein